MTYPAFLGAVVLTSANNRIRIRESATTYNADITPGTYFLRDDGTASSLCTAIATALTNASAGGNSYTCVHQLNQSPASLTNQITVSLSVMVDSFSLVRDGTQTFDYDLIGISATTSHDTGAKGSDRPCAAAWVSNDGYGEFIRRSRKVASQSMASSGRAAQVERSDRMYAYMMALKFVDERRLFRDLALSGYTANSLEAFLDRFGAGAYFELHDLEISSGTTLTDCSSSTLLATCQWDESTITDFEPDLVGAEIDLYDLS